MSVSQFVDEMQWENYNPISSYKWREESGDPLKNLFPFGIPNGVTYASNLIWFYATHGTTPYD